MRADTSFIFHLGKNQKHASLWETTYEKQQQPEQVLEDTPKLPSNNPAAQNK